MGGGDKGGSTTRLVAKVCNLTNPNFATTNEILAMYEVVDTYENVKAMFGSYCQQFVDLQTDVHIEVNGGGGEAALHVFLFGDYEFLTKFVGHNDPNAVYPCLWCYVHREELQKQLEERTLKSTHTNAVQHTI